MLAINQYQDYGSERASDIHNYSKPNSRPGVAFQRNTSRILYVIFYLFIIQFELLAVNTFYVPSTFSMNVFYIYFLLSFSVKLSVFSIF